MSGGRPDTPNGRAQAPEMALRARLVRSYHRCGGSQATWPGSGPAYASSVTPPRVREWLEDELRRAILTACEDDTVLFGRGACERSIMFRIGQYLAPVVEERWPGQLWVDCEYNRIATRAGEGCEACQRTGKCPGREALGLSRPHRPTIAEGRRAIRRSSSWRRRSRLQTAVGSRSIGGSSKRANGSSCTSMPFTSSSRRAPQWQWMGRDRELRPVTERGAGAAVTADMSG
jgi:hypothetical protein